MGHYMLACGVGTDAIKGYTDIGEALFGLYEGQDAKYTRLSLGSEMEWTYNLTATDGDDVEGCVTSHIAQNAMDINDSDVSDSEIEIGLKELFHDEGVELEFI